MLQLLYSDIWKFVIIICKNNQKHISNDFPKLDNQIYLFILQKSDIQSRYDYLENYYKQKYKYTVSLPLSLKHL